MKKIFALGILFLCLDASASNLSDALATKFHRTTCVGAATATHGRQPLYGTFNPAKTDSVGRYGFNYAKDCAGNYVGERLSPDTVFDVVRHPSNPLNMVNNQSYPSTPGGHCGSTACLSDLDSIDVALVADSSGVNVFDSYFMPLHRQLFPVSTPTPTASATATPRPSPSATPTPPLQTQITFTNCQAGLGNGKLAVICDAH